MKQPMENVLMNKSANEAYISACDPDTIRELLAERDALREALEMMVEMVEMNGFGRDYAMDVARAALAQKQGEKESCSTN